MYKKQPLILTICILVTGLIFFFWWPGSRDAANPVTTDKIAPPDITTQAQKPQTSNANYGVSEWARRMTARSNADDLESMTETFKESGNCLYYFIARSSANKSYAEEGATPERKLLWQSVLEQTEALCRGSDEETVARAFMVSVLEAAKKGNADAQSCFVILGDNFPSVNYEMRARYGKYLQARYIEHGPAIIQSALERGDPYVAYMLIYRHLPSGFIVDNPRVEEMIPPPDPYLTYRAAQLALYRTPPEFSSHKSLENNLNKFVELEILPDDKIVRAEDWAKTTYAHEFAHTLPIDPSKQTPCHSIAGSAP